MSVEPVAVLRTSGLALAVGADGTVRTVTSTADPTCSWLVDCGAPDLTTSRGPVALGAARVTVDRDEVETERSGGGLRVVVRHAVDQAWTVRLVLANESDAEVALEQVRLSWRAASGTTVTALPAGGRAAYAVQPAHGDGPVLVGRLQSGAQAGVGPDGLLLGPLALAPHHRWAVQWRWEVAPDARRAGARGELPRTTWLDLGQTVVLPSSPDVAVVAPGLAVELEDDDRVEVSSDEPGTFVVELRSARGTTACPLTWAPELDALVDATTETLLDGPTTPAGTPRLDGAASGLVVQDALTRRTAGWPDELADALELAAGELAEQQDDRADVVDPLALTFLAREADRSADPTLLDVALRRLLGTTTATPGLEVAGIAVALALVRTGRSTDALAAHLAGLRDLDARRGVGLRRLGARLGAGLPGRVVPPVALDEVAYASVVLGLVDETTGQRLRQGWGITASELARRTGAEARARVAGEERGPAVRRALAWLVLGRR